MIFLQLLLGFAALIGMGLLPHPFGTIFFLIWAVQIIFWELLREYYFYADWVRGYPSAERGVYRRLLCRKKVLSLEHLTLPHCSVLVQDDSGNLFQMIRCKHSMYFRVLRSRHNQNNAAISQSNLLIDDTNLSNGKKCGKKDFRFPMHQIQYASYIEQPVENTRFAAFGILQLQMQENIDKKNHRYYLLSKSTVEELAAMFDTVPFTDETETAPKYDTIWRVVKTLGKPRCCNLMLQVGLWFSAAWILSFTILPSSYLRIPVTFWLVCTVLLMLLCWAKSSLFSWGKCKDAEEYGIFGFDKTPCVYRGLFAPMLLLLVYESCRSNLVWDALGRYVLMCGIFGVVLCLLFLCTCRKRTASGIAWMVGLSLLFSCLSISLGNRIYDPYPPLRQTVTVVGKEYHSGGAKNKGWDELTLQREDGTQEILSNCEIYDDVEMGDIVTLQTHFGLLGIGYYTVQLP